MRLSSDTHQKKVHCRIGSLETMKQDPQKFLRVHCRIGSLENIKAQAVMDDRVHCRIGSLEKTGEYIDYE